MLKDSSKNEVARVSFLFFFIFLERVDHLPIFNKYLPIIPILVQITANFGANVSRNGLMADIQVNCAIVTRMFRALRCTVTPLRVRNAFAWARSNGGHGIKRIVERKEEAKRNGAFLDPILSFSIFQFIFFFFLIISRIIQREWMNSWDELWDLLSSYKVNF